MSETAHKLVKGVKSVGDFLGDAFDAFKDSKFIETIEKASPWLGLVGEAGAEALPPLKFVTKIANEFLKETDPEKIGFTACTIAFQNSVVTAFKKIGGPAGEKQAIKKAKEQLKEVENFDEVDVGTLKLDNALNHEFYIKSLLCFEVAAKNVGYVDSQVEDLTLIIQENFIHSLIKLLSDGSDKDKFRSFKDYLKLGGPEEKNVRKMLAQHANYQRWLFEQEAVLKVSPFALKHIYVDTDCKKTTWGEMDGSRDKRAGFLSDDRADREPLLETVIDLIKSPDLKDAIIIQGTAGSGKSSFTLKLYDELLERRLHPIRVRIKDLSFSSTLDIRDDLPKSIRFGEGEDSKDERLDEKTLFLDGRIFDERGVGEFSHISKYVIILDGWDEINLSNEGFKNKVARMLNQINDSFLRRANPRVRVILTGRPSSDLGDTQCLRANSPFLNIPRLTPEQLRSYIAGLRNAVNAKKPPIPRTELTESWIVPDDERFEPMIRQYEKAFDNQGQNESSALDILGLPLLAHLTVRLVAEWEGDLTPLLENPTTLYRHLIDLTCKEAGKVGDESQGQYKIYGESLRSLLWQTAHAITLSGSENISRLELISRLNMEDGVFDKTLTELEKENKLSSLLISFYFKGGLSHLGCEFAHKSFREYLFAEAVIEALKKYGRDQKTVLPPRANYWEDFPETIQNDYRFRLSRELAMLLSPQWIVPEVANHLRQLIKWEIGRTLNPEKAKQPGMPTAALTLEEWGHIRNGLTDLWEWWGEGVHLRPQRSRNQYTGAVELGDIAYVNNLIRWSAPRDERIQNWAPARTAAVDAHLGDGLFLLCTAVYAEMTFTDAEEKLREMESKPYRSVREVTGKIILSFKPSGEHRGYFQNYSHRINGAGWRPDGQFPRKCHIKFTDFEWCNLYLSCFDHTQAGHARFRNAIAGNASFWKSDLESADFQGASLLYTDFLASNLWNGNFVNTDLDYTNLREVTILNANFEGSRWEQVRLEDAEIDFTVTKVDGFESSVFDSVRFNGQSMSREKLFKQLEEQEENPD